MSVALASVCSLDLLSYLSVRSHSLAYLLARSLAKQLPPSHRLIRLHTNSFQSVSSRNRVQSTYEKERERVMRLARCSRLGVDKHLAVCAPEAYCDAQTVLADSSFLIFAAAAAAGAMVVVVVVAIAVAASFRSFASSFVCGADMHTQLVHCITYYVISLCALARQSVCV